MNESTFEARAHAALNYIFPNYTGLHLTHQLIFTVKLGHHEEQVRPNTKKPRLDILVSYKGTPLCVIELKRPSQPLTDDDRKQGLSYARLLTPIPPLVIVSDGKESSLFFNTYTGDALSVVTPDEVAFQQMITNALELASEEKDIAIRTLLGKDPEIWSNIIADLSAKGFENRKGPIEIFQQQIADGFLLSRTSTKKVRDLLRKTNPVISVTGAPLAGKTNVLYELCHLEDKPFVPLYINAVDCRYGILQYIANHFTSRFFSSTSAEDVRHWLIHGIAGRPHSAGKFVLIVDGVGMSETLLGEIDELINLITSNSSSCSLVIACDSSTFDQMSKIPGRAEKSLFGKKAIRVEVKDLDDNEFLETRKYLLETYKIGFYTGAELSLELRYPRVLRRMVARVYKYKRSDETLLRLPSFLSWRFFEEIITEFRSDFQFIEDMCKLAKGFLEMDSNDPDSPYTSLLSYGRGHIPYERGEELLGNDRIVRLMMQGHIDWFQDKDHHRYIVPKVPELFSAAAIEFLANEAKKKVFPEQLTFILEQSEKLPFGDLAAVGAIYKTSLRDDSFLNKAVNYLIGNPPIREGIDPGFKGVAYFEDTGFIQVPIPFIEEHQEDIKTIANHFPWLVLSQLAIEGLKVKGGEVPPESLLLGLMEEVGSYPDVLRRFLPASRFDETQEISTHTLRSSSGEVGTVICGKQGVIEPITYAMQQGFYEMPEQMIRLCKKAVVDKNTFLAHRLHNAASTVLDVVKQDTAKVARKALQLLSGVLHHG